MPVEFDRGSPGKFDSRTLNMKTLNRWTERTVAPHIAVTVLLFIAIATGA